MHRKRRGARETSPDVLIAQPPIDNSYPQLPPGVPIARGLISESSFAPNSSHFRSDSRFPPGFDYRHSFHEVKMMFQESLKGSSGEGVWALPHIQESWEITSDRPFLPRKRSPPRDANITNSSSRISKGDKRGDRIEEPCGPSLSPRTLASADGPIAQDTSQGRAMQLLPTGKKNKTKKQSAENIQPACADPIVLPSSAEEARSLAPDSSSLGEPSSIPGVPLVSRSSIGGRPSILGEPPVSSSGAATTHKQVTVDISAEQATESCHKLRNKLNIAMQHRERFLKERERKFTQSLMKKQVLEEEMKEIADMQNDVMEEQRLLKEEEQRIRKEKEAIERASIDIAVQMTELKQLQMQIEEEKAAVLALKAELGVSERCSQERDHVETTVDTYLSAVKLKIDKSSVNLRVNSSCGPNISSEPGAIQSGMHNQEPGKAMVNSKLSPAVSHRNFKSAKAEPVTPEADAAHVDKTNNNDDSSDDDMDDVPLATRLSKQRVEKVREKRRSAEESNQHEFSNVESSKRRADVKREPLLLGGKSSSHDIHAKRNKVSIEVALQEDAPGLLEQLEERGLLEDMDVYEDLEMDDSLATESPGCGFGQLEGVIGKAWGSSSGLGKDLLPPKVQQGSGIMPRYCLACLLSLIEQTRLLRKRKWPVEWGWSRRLRAFLFVFEKHNRIVLERPEYGYATYFFELVQGLPVKWQVQRLIAVMSVATTGRAALLDNRQLVVGVDITQEEASILEDYGWSWGSGLGSLLNFCHRVVHDYNKGQDSADLGNEWKQKIGKLLMDGYDQGRMIVGSIPKKLPRNPGNHVLETDPSPGLNVKTELPWSSNNV
nr:hypothetical protein PHYPA_028340 [Physcomitrium patens]